MTTSPSPSPSRQASEESAKAVGFQLVKHYYTNLMSNPDSIYGMYGKSACLQHHNPFRGDFSRIDIAYSREEIRDHYKTNSVFQGCKILVQNLDAQPSIDESVMILCNGEIAFNSKTKIGPAYKFVQSFYITPKKSDNVTYYDIINDILRFIPDVDEVFMNGGEEKGEKEEVKEEVVEKEITNGGSKPVEEETKEPEEKLIKESSSSQEEATADNSEEITTTLVEVESKQEEQQPPVVSSTSSKPISWAARVATSSTPVAKSAKIVSPQVTSATVNSPKETTPVSSKELTKNQKRRSSGGKKSAKKEDSPPFSSNNKTLKKKFTNKRNEEVYPIYIRGINSEIDTEEQLASLLEREFGRTDSCKLNNSVALVDFVKLSAQEKAIRVGTIKLNDHDLKLEPRIDKKKERK